MAIQSTTHSFKNVRTRSQAALTINTHYQVRESKIHLKKAIELNPAKTITGLLRLNSATSR